MCLLKKPTTAKDLEDMGYVIHKDGTIIGKRGKPMKYRITHTGYYFVPIHLGKKYGCIRKNMVVHRLLAMKFIPNPLNLPEVNHKDGNKLNFSLDNLEWVSRSENIRHAYKTGLIKKYMTGRRGYDHPDSKVVLQTKDGIIIDEFGSISEASRQTGCHRSSIWRSLNSKKKVAGGYKWNYKQ